MRIVVNRLPGPIYTYELEESIVPLRELDEILKDAGGVIGDQIRVNNVFRGYLLSDSLVKGNLIPVEFIRDLILDGDQITLIEGVIPTSKSKEEKIKFKRIT